jgi:hypothetical protein
MNKVKHVYWRLLHMKQAAIELMVSLEGEDHNKAASLFYDGLQCAEYLRGSLPAEEIEELEKEFEAKRQKLVGR